MQKYRYILLSNDTGERVVLNDAPIGWDAQKINIIRDLVYFGVLKSISVEFDFVGDGYRYLQQQYLKFGIDANILIRIYKKNEFQSEGKINLERFEDDRSSRRFKVDIIQSGFVQKFHNREDVQLNILNDISLDRNQIEPAYTKEALIRSKSIEFYSEFQGSLYDSPEIYHHIIPFKILVNGNPYVQEVSNFETNTEIELLYNVENAIIRNDIPQSQTIIIEWSINYTIKLIYNNLDFSSNILLFKMLILNEDNSVYQTLFSRRFQDSYGTYSDYFSDTVTLLPGQYIILINERYWQFAGGEDLPGGPDTMENLIKIEVKYNSMSLYITQSSAFSDSNTPVVLPHELFTNIIAQVTGKDNAFYSEFFGREELGYEEDGEGAYLAITKGDLLRGVPLTETQIATSMRDAFTSYNAVYNLGVHIIGEQIIIEPKDELFNQNIALDLGEVSELKVKPTTEFLFNSVKAGYPKNEYEQENGRDEFNTEAQYTNSLQGVKKELNLMSVYYGDGYGIEFARRLAIAETGTSDSKYDDKIFFIDLIKEDDQLMSRRLEGIGVVEGIFSPETAMNLRISAGQNLLRWQKYLNIPLHRKPDKVYFFQSKDKNASLNITTELGQSVDGQDLQLSNNAYFLPEEKRFKTPLTLDNLFSILENPLGLVKYSHNGEVFFDYLFEVDGENEKATGTWRMLSTKPTPIEQVEDAVYGDFLKYGDGTDDFIKYGDGVEDIILYE